MSEESKIHHASQISSPAIGVTITSDWDTVTCGTCLLERPIKKTQEYRNPVDVLERDRMLAGMDRVRRMLADAKRAVETAERLLAEMQGAENGKLSEARSVALSGRAQDALRACGTTKIGGVVSAACPPEVWEELRGMDMIGRNGGLTVKGSILAERLQDAEIERLFPL